MKSVMDHKFSEIPRAEIPRSSFDRSHGHKTTFDFGKLIPIYIDEALPGDTFNMKMTGFDRDWETKEERGISALGISENL